MQNGQFKTLPPISSDECGSSTDPHRAAYAAERAALLLGCYRRGDAENPDLYVAAIAAVMADYPVDIIKRVTDPRTGIPGRSKWLPAVAEIRDFCEAEYEPVRRRQEYDRRAEERKRALPPPDDRASRPTVADLKAKYGENWGIEAGPTQKQRREGSLKEIEAANRIVFERECRREGIEPKGGVSPSLLRLIKGEGNGG